ncbi:FG-GAP repeat protein [Streptomyces sp. LN785]|uniref:FG-GAP repeat protein n=1 Tax=Streptomyces sp. LN785 TaxID=3112983 RepID=UPI0037162BEF
MSGRRITSCRPVALVAAVAAVAAALSGGTASAAPMPVPQDINGDGYRDLVVPAPGATVAGHDRAGSLVVLYGSAKGVSAARRAVITQNSAGIPGSAEADDLFGASSALADLDHDGYTDLVVGAPGEDVGTTLDSGAVYVLWGSAKGLVSGATLPTQVLRRWGAGADVAAVSGPGRARVLISNHNFTTELTGPFSRSGTVGSSVPNEDIGWMRAVAYGDVNGDGVAEQIQVTGPPNGSSGGRVLVDPVPGSFPPPLLEGEGLNAAVGDVNGDGYGDVAAGDPDEPSQVGPIGHVGGSVSVWFGSAKGVALDRAPMTFHQNTAGVPGSSERGDSFGAAVAVADLNRDGLADIVVGAPGEAIGATSGAGTVTVVPGRRTGQLGTGSYTFKQDTPGVPGTPEKNDLFGCTVTAGDLTRDGRPEIVVGASEEDGRGAVWMLPGGTTRPVYTSALSFGTGSLGLPAVGGTMLGGDWQQ